MFRFLICTLCATLSCVFSSAGIAAPVKTSEAALFGTGMVSVRTTPYDAKWRRASSMTLGSAAGIAETARKMVTLEKIRFVNSAVNARITYKNEAQDSWTNTSRTFSSGNGDCEDYAIAKMQILHSIGLPSSDLYLVVGRDLVTRSGHAVLVVRYEGKNWVLDNFVNEVRPDKSYGDFQPVMTLSSGGSWLHGGKIVTPISLAMVSSGQKL